MRLYLPAALALCASLSAQAQVVPTSVTAASPDPNGKVPGFNLVPGAGIANWANGLAQAVLVHGNYYNFCVSLASATANGQATVSYAVMRGKARLLSKVIIKGSQLPVGSDSVWYFCSGYTQIPNSPGNATLVGTVSYLATGSTKPAIAKTTTQVFLQ